MKRRQVLLATGGTVAIAGCIGDQEEPTGDRTEEEETEGPESEAEEPTEEEPEEEESEEEDPEEPEPAEFEITDLVVEPTEVSPGESFSVAVTVGNIGDEGGSYTVELQIDSGVEDATDIELEGGQQTTVKFEFSIDDPGSYDVSVGESLRTLQVVAEPEIILENRGLASADTVFHDTYAEAVVENIGDHRSGRVELTVRWIDDSGSVVGEDSTSIPTLGAGERWIARVGNSREENEISDFELVGEYDVSAGTLPDGMSVADSTFNIEDEFSGSITAEIDNTRDESLFMASFRGNIYNNNGDVLTGTQTLESAISPGEDIFFELSLSSTRAVHRINKAVDHQVLLTGSETTDIRQFE